MIALRRIHTAACAFGLAWVLYAGLVERGETLFAPNGTRFAAGCAGVVIVLTAWMIRDGLAAKTPDSSPMAETRTAEMPPVVKAEKPPGTSSAQMPKARKTATLDPADEAWDQARRMPHSVVPDYGTDGAYLSLVRYAGDLGHVAALVKLGEYAERRGCHVEAAYWECLAMLRGEDDGGRRMKGYSEAWVDEGCPNESECENLSFKPEQGSFGRAVLRYFSCVDRKLALLRFHEMAEEGNEDARAFLIWAGERHG